MPARNLLVVNQFYAPDYAATGQVAAELCAGLAAKGLRIRVVAGEPSYTEAAPAAPAYEKLDGVEVHRVAMGGARGRERLERPAAGGSSPSSSRAGGWRARCRRPSDPTPSSPSATRPSSASPPRLVARRSKARFVYVLHDIHPDILLASGFKMLPRPALWAFDLVHRWVLRRADAIVVLGHGMKRTLVEKKGVDADARPRHPAVGASRARRATGRRRPAPGAERRQTTRCSCRTRATWA